ncbi:MAG: 50S ribosomal protein L29 [Candidatus Aenigmarchaeota archaeon]|nr:50S ribosomal protein L29 [Candidatus Aenigmarchaeota archaeon]
MAIIKKKQIHEMSIEDLEKHLSELRLEFSKDMAQIGIGGSPKNPGKVKETKKTIARILTEKKKREGGI